MSYKVEIDYGTGWIDLTAKVKESSLQRTENLMSNDRKPVVNGARFSVKLETSLAHTLLTLDAAQAISCRITSSGSAWFTGSVRPVTDFTVDKPAQEISFEAVGNLYSLKKKVTTTISKSVADSMVVSRAAGGATSLVHVLLAAAEYPGTIDVPDILDPISYYLAEAGDNAKDFFDLLHDLLYSYHRVFYEDAAGIFKIHNWGPSSIASSGTFNSANIVRPLIVSRDDQDEDSVSVEYYKVQTETDKMVFSGEASGFGTCRLVGDDYKYPPQLTDDYLEKYLDWGTDESETKKAINVVHKSYRYFISKINQGILSELWMNHNQWYSDSFGDPLKYFHVDEYTVETDKARSIFHGIGANVEIKTVEVYADVTYKIKQGSITYPETGEKPKKISTEHIYSKEAAEDLAAANYKNLTASTLKYKFRSRTAATVGLYYTVQDITLNISTTVRLTKRTTTHFAGVEIYDYEAEGASPIETVIATVLTGAFSVTVPPAIAAAAAAANEGLLPSGQIVQAIEAHLLNETFVPATSGLFFSNTYLGFYAYDDETSSGEWTAYIKNDGSGKFVWEDHLFAWGPAARPGDLPGVYLKGTLELDGDSIIRGTITSGNGVYSEDYDPGVAGWAILGSGDVEFRSGSIGAWVIEDPLLRDENSLIVLDPSKSRIEIRAAVGTKKIALGYLYGIGSYTVNDYGLYIAPGNAVYIEGGADFANGDFLIRHDAAYVVQDSEAAEVIRLGSLGSGDIGLKIGDVSTGPGLLFSLGSESLTIRGTLITDQVQVEDTYMSVSDGASSGAYRLQAMKNSLDLQLYGTGWDSKIFIGLSGSAWTINAKTPVVTLGAGTFTYPSTPLDSSYLTLVFKGSGSDGRLTFNDGTGNINFRHNCYAASTSVDYYQSASTGCLRIISTAGGFSFLHGSGGTAGGAVTYATSIAIDSSAIVRIRDDQDATTYIGRAGIGYHGAHTDFASFSHRDMIGTAGAYALLQGSNGATYLNAASGTAIYFRINNTTFATMTAANVTCTYANTSVSTPAISINSTGSGSGSGSQSVLDFQSNGTQVAYIRADSGGNLCLVSKWTLYLGYSGENWGMRIWSGTGYINAPGVYNQASLSGRYVGVRSDGEMYSVTSSAKYKTGIEDIEEEYFEKVWDLRPVYFRSKNKLDNPDWSWYGLIAEEVAEIEPRLVQYDARKDGTLVPEGVAYLSLPVLILAALKKYRREQDTNIAQLSQQIKELKGE